VVRGRDTRSASVSARAASVDDNRAVPRPSALLGSLALHAVIAVGIGAIARDRDAGGRAREAPGVVAIEVIAAAHASAHAPVAGGGAADARAATSAPRVATTAQPGRARRTARARSVILDGDLAIAPTTSRGTAASAAGVEREGDGGEGTGTGGHRGAGIGFGDGGRIELVRDLPALPPAPAGDTPRPSKARPAKLVYPARQRDGGDDELFVARVIVDTDGYVVGARLVRGRGGPRDDLADDLIFRFRYLPALDDDGRAIRATFDQKFLVGR